MRKQRSINVPANEQYECSIWYLLLSDPDIRPVQRKRRLDDCRKWRRHTVYPRISFGNLFSSRWDTQVWIPSRRELTSVDTNHHGQSLQHPNEFVASCTCSGSPIYESPWNNLHKSWKSSGFRMSMWEDYWKLRNLFSYSLSDPKTDQKCSRTYYFARLESPMSPKAVVIHL